MSPVPPKGEPIKDDESKLKFVQKEDVVNTESPNDPPAGSGELINSDESDKPDKPINPVKRVLTNIFNNIIAVSIIFIGQPIKLILILIVLIILKFINAIMSIFDFIIVLVARLSDTILAGSDYWYMKLLNILYKDFIDAFKRKKNE